MTLPKKPSENDTNEEECDGQHKTCSKQELNVDHRGPTPLQRSPFMDNVALRALDDEQNLKMKEESIADDIADQLSQITLLARQHMTEQGLVKKIDQ